MKILLRGSEYATSNKQVIEQMLKHGGKEVKAPAKVFTKPKPIKQVNKPINKPVAKKPVARKPATKK